MKINPLNNNKQVNQPGEPISPQETFEQIENQLYEAFLDLENGVATKDFSKFHNDMITIDNTLFNFDTSKLPQSLRSAFDLLQQNVGNLLSATYSSSDPNGLFFMLGQAAAYCQSIVNGLG